MKIKMTKDATKQKKTCEFIMRLSRKMAEVYICLFLVQFREKIFFDSSRVHLPFIFICNPPLKNILSLLKQNNPLLLGFCFFSNFDGLRSTI
jgi:hypothetical protein